jgi:hypothetical protein
MCGLNGGKIFEQASVAKSQLFPNGDKVKMMAVFPHLYSFNKRSSYYESMNTKTALIYSINDCNSISIKRFCQAKALSSLSRFCDLGKLSRLNSATPLTPAGCDGKKSQGKKSCKKSAVCDTATLFQKPTKESERERERAGERRNAS